MLTVRPSVREQFQEGNVRKAWLSSVILFDKFGGLYMLIKRKTTPKPEQRS